MKTILDRIAALISVFLSPVILLPVMTVVYLLNKNVAASELQSSLGLFFLFGFLPIVLFLIILRKLGKISDWDIRKRQERYLFNSGVLVIGILFLVLLAVLGNSVLFKIASIFMFWSVAFSAVTFFWKISGHTSIYTLFYLLALKNSPFWFFGIVLLPLLIWSRRYLKHHTLLQGIAGVILTVMVFGVAHYFSVL